MAAQWNKSNFVFNKKVTNYKKWVCGKKIHDARNKLLTISLLHISQVRSLIILLTKIILGNTLFKLILQRNVLCFTSIIGQPSYLTMTLKI